MRIMDRVQKISRDGVTHRRHGRLRGTLVAISCLRTKSYSDSYNTHTARTHARILIFQQYDAGHTTPELLYLF